MLGDPTDGRDADRDPRFALHLKAQLVECGVGRVGDQRRQLEQVVVGQSRAGATAMWQRREITSVTLLAQ